MNKQIWKLVMFGASLVLLLGFVVALWSVHEDSVTGVYLGLVTIGAVCVSWWFWVMFIIRTMISQSDRTCSQLKEVRTGISEVKHLVKEYVEDKSVSNRQRRKSTAPRP
jgi:protein-S-isoprenylcysteine O-methyltransferase Ste14